MSQFVALRERSDRVGGYRPMTGDGDDVGTGQPGGGRCAGAGV